MTPLPSASGPRTRIVAAILGLIGVPVLIALAESLGTGNARHVCFVAAAAAAIAAVAMLASSLEVHVDRRGRAQSSQRDGSHLRAPGRKRAGSS
ncbi:MAG: hypothetical protein ABI682_08635 [Acidobacteriota bacterium]